MFFIDKDQRGISWQTKKNKHNFIETSVTSSFPSPFFHLDSNCFAGSMAEVSCVEQQAINPSLIPFFSCHQDLFLISVLQNCSELAFVLGFSVKFGQICLPLYNFCSHRPLVELLILRKPTKSPCFLEDIRVPFDYKQEISTKH